MRFSFATAVLSLAAMAAAVPTDVLVARSGTDGCANVQGNIQCCNSVSNSNGSPGGLLGPISSLNGLLQCVPITIPIPILGAALGNNGFCSSGKQTCCIKGSNAQPQSGVVNVGNLELPVLDCGGSLL